MKNMGEVWQEVDTAVCRFLDLEVDIGLTFAKAAIYAGCTEECLHYRGIARQSYDVARNGIRCFRFQEGERKSLDRKLQCLRSALRQSGDPVISGDGQLPKEG